MEGSIFAEIRTDYADDKGVIHLDAFKTDDDNEEGTIVGFFVNGEIYYRDPEFQFDPYVKEVVAELKADYETTKKEKQEEIRLAIQNVYYNADSKPRPEFTGGSVMPKLKLIEGGAEEVMKICNF